MKKLLFLIISLLIMSAGMADAATCADHDTWGYAWSDNIGWLSFSCRNNNPVGSGINYGVDISDTTGEMSGYAWSENIGWISFNTSELSSCPSGSCEATVDLETGALSGWARALAPVGQPLEKTGGWDGWISLGGASYQVQVNSGPSPSEFGDWAWGSDVIGWLSFNCSNTDTCGTVDYKVYTSFNIDKIPEVTPEVRDTSDDPSSNCFATSAPVFFDWTFDDPGDTQSAYQIQVDDNSDFSSPEKDTGKILSASNSYAPPGLPFNTAYYWRIQVWDSGNQSSGWVLPSPTSFTTNSRWPRPSFTWIPATPIVDSGVAFDGSVDYCSSCSYAWNAKDSGGGTVWTSIIEDPVETFTIEDIYTVTFTATSGSRSCSIPHDISVGGELPLPSWQEITPF